jgi:hypothetical protein
MENRYIEVKKIKGKWHYFIDLTKTPIEHIDMYVQEIQSLMKQHKPKQVNPDIMAMWSNDENFI